MSCPAGVGPEFTVPAPPVLRVKNARAGAWPYASSCTQGANNGLRLDATGGLWADPSLYGPVSDAQHVSGYNKQLNPTPTWVAGTRTATPDKPVTLTNTLCVPIQVMLFTRLTVTCQDFSGSAWFRLFAYVGTGTLPTAPYTGLPGFDSRCDPLVGNQTTTMLTVPLNAQVNLNVPVAANSTVTLHRMSVVQLDSSYAGGSNAFIKDYSAVTSGFWFTTPTPI